MQIRFLLGPAGSGKTHRCLAEIRSQLSAGPDGLPLILLAPKQATFQLERQLLGAGSLAGYTRLRILSFPRLAEFIFDQLGKPVPKLLAEEGRLMALRALLEQNRGNLELFRASARLPGFAQQLSELLRELQQYRLTPGRLSALAERIGTANRLNAKLRDLALMLQAYDDWLKEHQLEDADRLLDLAADALDAPVRIQAVWLDGFAQMTPQERRLLVALCRCAATTALSFCLDAEPQREAPWHSTWAPVTETFLHCRDELRALPDSVVEIEVLQRNPLLNRFAGTPALQHLEQFWSKAATFEPVGPKAGHASAGPDGDAQQFLAIRHSSFPIHCVAGANPEAEVEFAAREIHRAVREGTVRFRDVAVLLRSLDGYHSAIRRVFARYEIPFFLDRRESVTHHPLAELTRYALRIAAYNWEHDDWFGALKTGLVWSDDAAIDALENAALAHGWHRRSFWSEPISGATASAHGPDKLELLRQKIVPPFLQFSETMAGVKQAPTGAQLARAFRDLWEALKAGTTLERWSAVEPNSSAKEQPHRVHEAVWDQMNEWLKNLELGFPTEAIALNDWLPIIEAGLGNLSIGVVPPALDQVLVGTVDRSRNPDLQIAFVMGLNEGVFPAPPPPPILLSRSDRETLASQNASIGPDYLQQIGLERYYGYIACTRARKQLVLSCAHRDANGRELNASQFVADLRRMFPELAVEEFSGVEDWKKAEHWSELLNPLLRDNSESMLPAGLGAAAPMLEPALAKWQQMKLAGREEPLPTGLVERLYGLELRTSVSGLEDFAACPFKFLAGRGLRAEERPEFELDPREKGSFQHEVMKEFHLRLQRTNKRWREVSPDEARKLVREVGESLAPEFRDGLFNAGEGRRFTAHMLIEGLEQLVGTLVIWAKQYQFDPAVVETGFGLGESSLPAWRIDLDGKHALLLRGRIDRIDVFRIPETDTALGVVIDYKSSARQLDPVLVQNGLELQLLAYLGALSQFQRFDESFNLSRIIPAGAFFVALKSVGGSAKTRDDGQEQRGEAAKSGFQHRGRFDGGHLEKFDPTGAKKGNQFRYSINKDGAFAARGNEALPSKDFQELVAGVGGSLKQHGREIYAGKASVSPYRWKNETACDFCKYRPVCRFDPWTQPYNVLRPPPK